MGVAGTFNQPSQTNHPNQPTNHPKSTIPKVTVQEMGTFMPGERLSVKLKTQQYNIHNLETLDWTKDIKIAKLKKYHRAFLKRKHALRYFIQVTCQ